MKVTFEPGDSFFVDVHMVQFFGTVSPTSHRMESKRVSRIFETKTTKKLKPRTFSS